MRWLFRIIGYGALAVALVVVGLLADMVLNRHRLIDRLLGRDSLVAACRPALLRELAAKGFEPVDVELGDDPDITISSATGRMLGDTFTFEDGASGGRVDGAFTCRVTKGGIKLDLRTSITPMRAT